MITTPMISAMKENSLDNDDDVVYGILRHVDEQNLEESTCLWRTVALAYACSL